MSLSVAENELITHVGPGTPGGAMMRRYWHPIGFASEFKGRPIRRRLLGEDLVMFRDDRGRLGLLTLRCSHRGTSLEFGHIEDGGLRCCYHGWLYDVDGKILQMPGEPPESTYKDRIKQLLGDGVGSAYRNRFDAEHNARKGKMKANSPREGFKAFLERKGIR